MNVTEGNLIKFALDGPFDVIIHACNCQCAMAQRLQRLSSKPFLRPTRPIWLQKRGSREKLGSISAATVTRGAHQITIVNGYT